MDWLISPRLIIMLSIGMVGIAWAYSLASLVIAYRRRWFSQVLRNQTLSWLWPMVAFGPLVLAMLLLALWATP